MTSAVVALLAVVASSGPSPLDAAERKIRVHVEKNAGDAIRLVETVSKINSGTLNPPGVRTVGDIFRQRLDAIGFDTTWIEMPKSMKRAGHLFATRSGKRGKRVLLIGHLDTVFEPNDPFQDVKIDGDVMTGPGVFDMKGGDVVILSALEAMDAAGVLDGATITVALIGDEEKVGSPRTVARRDLIAAAKASDVALGFEPGLGERNVSIARRGSSSWRLTVRAKGGHSSMVGHPTLGHGAIYEAARFLDETRRLFAKSKTVTINPGLVVGGTDATMNGSSSEGRAEGKNNKIGAVIRVSGDLRFLTEDEKSETREQMKRILDGALAGTDPSIEFTDGYPAMPPTDANRALFEQIDQVNRALGHGPMELVPPEKRGAADISFVAPYVAALAGLGPSGHGAHTRKERMKIPTLRLATERTAVLLYRLTK